MDSISIAFQEYSDDERATISALLNTLGIEVQKEDIQINHIPGNERTFMFTVIDHEKIYGEGTHRVVEIQVGDKHHTFHNPYLSTGELLTEQSIPVAMR